MPSTETLNPLNPFYGLDVLRLVGFSSAWCIVRVAILLELQVLPELDVLATAMCFRLDHAREFPMAYP